MSGSIRDEQRLYGADVADNTELRGMIIDD